MRSAKICVDLGCRLQDISRNDSVLVLRKIINKMAVLKILIPLNAHLLHKNNIWN